jgi:hypothetical protein
VALIDGRTWSVCHRRSILRPYDVLEAVEVLFQQLGFDPADTGLFGLKVLQFLSSSEERRLGEYEGMSWWQYLGGDRYSQKCQNRASGIPRMLVAMDAQLGNARTIGCTSMQLLLDFTTSGIANDRTMGGPTSEMWIDPWVEHLKAFGVEFHPGERCAGLDVSVGCRSRLPRGSCQTNWRQSMSSAAGCERPISTNSFRGWLESSSTFMRMCRWRWVIWFSPMRRGP